MSQLIKPSVINGPDNLDLLVKMKNGMTLAAIGEANGVHIMETNAYKSHPERFILKSYFDTEPKEGLEEFLAGKLAVIGIKDFTLGFNMHDLSKYCNLPDTALLFKRHLVQQSVRVRYAQELE